MRHSTGRVDLAGADSVAGASVSRAAENPSTQSHLNLGGNRHSLAAQLDGGRFFACDDIAYSAIAASIETASPGELVVYRVGVSSPTQFIADALAVGVAGILTEQLLPCPLAQCIVGDMDLALAEIASVTHDRPDRKVLTIAVTGSAGKTTTSLMIASILRQAKVRAAYQTDLGDCDGIVQSTSDAPLLTASPLIDWLAEAVDSECGAAIIELDEASLTYGHYDSIEFDVLVVTGAAQSAEHFGPSSLQCAIDRIASDGVIVANADDPRVERVARESGARMVTYGTIRSADVSAKIIEQSGGMSTILVATDDLTAAMETSLCGGAMASCHAAATTLGLLIGQSLTDVLNTLGTVRQLPGRMQSITSFGQPAVYLDVAGSPKRLASALRATRAMQQGKLWCVLSMTGSESSAELAEYGRIAERFSGQVVLTCHTAAKPHFLELAHAVLDGVKKCAAIRWVADWNQAIRWTIGQAKSNDTVLVVGGVRRGSPMQHRREIATIETWIESAIESRVAAEPAEGAKFKIVG